MTLQLTDDATGAVTEYQERWSVGATMNAGYGLGDPTGRLADIEVRLHSGNRAGGITGVGMSRYWQPTGPWEAPTIKW